MLVLELVVFIYYTFIFLDLSYVITYIMNLLQAVIQITICFIYCYRSSRLFSDRKIWFRALKIISGVSIAIISVLIIISFVHTVKKKNHKDYYLTCTTPVYFYIDAS